MSLIALISCSGTDTNQLEPGVLEVSKMSEILYDLNIAETQLLRKNETQQIQELQRKSDLDFVLKKHNVSDSIFKKSYDFYSKNPTWMKQAVESAIEKVDEQSTTLDK